jgi:DNA repair exonuclease SbcCD ATPase subunit
MRILSCQAQNFGSYKELNLDLADTGLSLVYGRTGSGKSTLPDVVAWTLFGTTAKDGAADDVRSWQADGPTVATVEVHTSVAYLVTRIRGGSKNDLYFCQADGEKIRGKDITETQRLLEQRLGVTADLFIAASYFHEFSPTGSFFTAKAKERRALFEKLAPLELPKKLAERSSEERKATKESYAQKEKEYAKAQGRYEELERAHNNCIIQSKNWDNNHKRRLQDLQDSIDRFEGDRRRKCNILKQKSENFEADKQARIEPLLERLEQLTAELEGTSRPAPTPAVHCKACGNTTAAASALACYQYDQKLVEQNSLIDRIEARQAVQNNYQDQIKMIELEPNPYKVNLEYAVSESNPHVENLKKYRDDACQWERSAVFLGCELEALSVKMTELYILYTLAADLRGELLKNAVKGVEKQTNKLLETYFDSEIRVTFELDSDALNVAIQKSGFDCNYKQLSKGQRGLLKLCFSVAIMGAASDRAGVHFSNLFFDEALDGLDADLKAKSFMLFQSLAQGRDSIMVIDHNLDFQNLFDRKYRVTLEGDFSLIEEEQQ